VPDNLNASAKIPPMQAFWVRASTEGSSNLDLTSAMVSHDNSSTNKLKAPAVERQMVRLQVSNNVNSDELVIYTDANALNTFDRYDAPKMSNESNEIPEISCVVGSEYLVINGLNSLELDSEIPVHFMTKTANAFTFKANQVSNLPEGVKLILKDNSTEFDLTNGTAYNFSSDVADTSNRFSIVFRSPGVTTDVDNQGNSSKILVYSTNQKNIEVKYEGEISDNASASVYNSMGQLIKQQDIFNGRTTLTVPATGVYVVKVVVNGKESTNRVVVK
jgi:hypothetical protein